MTSAPAACAPFATALAIAAVLPVPLQNTTATFFICVPSFLFSDRYSKFCQPVTGFDAPAVRICAFFVFFKGTACLFFIAVNLPIPDEFIILCVVLDEPPDIFRRIAQKQADLMRELVSRSDSPDQPADTLLITQPGITRLIQDFSRSPVLHIPLQRIRPEEIEQGLPVMETKRQNAHPPCGEDTVEAAQFIGHFFPAGIFAAEHAAGLDPGQRRCAAPHKHFVRHRSPPSCFFSCAQAITCFSSTFRSADRELVLQCSMTVFCPFSSLIAPRSILWDIVSVKKIIRSGLPTLSRNPPRGFVKTFA